MIAGAVVLLSIADYALLFFSRGYVQAEREAPARLSMGDENKLAIQLRNTLPFDVRVKVIDELPEQFQERNFSCQ